VTAAAAAGGIDFVFQQKLNVSRRKKIAVAGCDDLIVTSGN
jgi:hypothetical protein